MGKQIYKNEPTPIIGPIIAWEELPGTVCNQCYKKIWNLFYRAALLLLILSGEIQTNIGPSTMYPCGYCQMKVGWSAQALACDECSVWFHKSCLELGSEDYHHLELEGSVVSWICNHCNAPNYDGSLFRSFEVEIFNSYIILNHLDAQLDSLGPRFDPPLTSSPIKQKSSVNK